MEEKSDCKPSQKRKTRPAQKLYVPPAQRYTNTTKKDKHKPQENTSKPEIKPEECASKPIKPESPPKPVQDLVIMLDKTKVTEEEEKSIDFDKQEMERAIVNINRKTRPLIKHINVGNNNVLYIDEPDKTAKKTSKIKLPALGDQVSSWEDLLNEDDDVNSDSNEQETVAEEKIESFSDDEEEDEHYPSNSRHNDLDHVIELYDFAPTFKTQDIMLLYHEINSESMYIKWCDETHALLILSTPAQAQKALMLKYDLIKSRTMSQASSIAIQVASKSDLKPAMKRPQTNMQTARRLITSHLGTKSRLSKEEQQREREELRRAKELKRERRQYENDAWEGNPRPSTA